MAKSSWSSTAYSNLVSTKSYRGKSTNQIFTNTKVIGEMSPKGIKFREARDSDVNPESLAIIVNLDETGSMGDVAAKIAKEKLGTLMTALQHNGIKDATVLFNGIGDHHSDQYFLQVGQFESGAVELDKWLTAVVMEGNGGGQQQESYLLAWLLAAKHTSIDCFEKRKQKGILFTIGDEASWDSVDSDTLKELMGYAESQDYTDKELLAEAQRMYHVFHIHVEEGSYPSNSEYGKKIIEYWRGMLKENLIICKDYNQIAELIATTVAMIHGIDIDKAVSVFDVKTAEDVKDALVHVNTSIIKQQDNVIQL